MVHASQQELRPVQPTCTRSPDGYGRLADRSMPTYACSATTLAPDSRGGLRSRLRKRSRESRIRLCRIRMGPRPSIRTPAPSVTANCDRMGPTQPCRLPLANLACQCQRRWPCRWRPAQPSFAILISGPLTDVERPTHMPLSSRDNPAALHEGWRDTSSGPVAEPGYRSASSRRPGTHGRLEGAWGHRCAVPHQGFKSPPVRGVLFCRRYCLAEGSAPGHSGRPSRTWMC